LQLHLNKLATSRSKVEFCRCVRTFGTSSRRQSIRTSS
jgi:hypothetical protein